MYKTNSNLVPVPTENYIENLKKTNQHWLHQKRHYYKYNRYNTGIFNWHHGDYE